jgi:hypothetical protein
MRKGLLISIALFFTLPILAGHVFYLHSGGEIVEDEKCSDLDSFRFVGGVPTFIMEDGKRIRYTVSELDSMSFEKIVDAANSDTVFVTFQEGTNPIVVNPFADKIDVSIEDGGVFVNSFTQLENVVYSLSGTSSNSYFHIESQRKFNLHLNNLNLTSQGVLSPIRSFAGSSMNLILEGVNVLADTPADTCNAVLRSKGQIIVGGAGELTINAFAKRGMQSGDFIEFNSGIVGVNADQGDAVKMNDYFEMNGGVLSIKGNGIEIENGYALINGGSIIYKNLDSKGNYIDDAKGLKCDGDTSLAVSSVNRTVTINGGDITFDVGGDGSRFIRCAGDVVVNGGSISGVLKANSFFDYDKDDDSYSCIIKADRNIQILGGKHVMTVAEEAAGARGLAADSSIIIAGNGSVVNVVLDMKCDYYINKKDKPKAGYGLKTDGSVVLANCDLSIVGSTGEYSAIPLSAYELSVNDGAKAELVSYTSNYCEMKGSIFLNGGQVMTISPNCTNLVTTYLYGGTMVSLGYSAYGSYYVHTKSSYSAVRSKMAKKSFQLKNSDGQELLTFQVPSAYSSLFGSDVYMFIFDRCEKNSDYTLSVDGTVLGGTEKYGFYQGATYSGGTPYAFKPTSTSVEAK